MIYRPKYTELGKKLITPNQTSTENIRATEIIQAEKEKELASDPRAKQWEADRKKEWAANKPYYMKSKEKEDPTKKIMDDIYHGGKFKALIPAPNLLLVKVDKEETTAGGIILPTEAQAPNTGIVIDASEQAFLPSGNVCNMLYKRGDHLLYRKFSGMEVEVNGNKLLMLTLQDVLGLIEV
jgi:chaperonin GroES